MKKMTILTVLLVAISAFCGSAFSAESDLVKQGSDLICSGEIEKAEKLLENTDNSKAKELLGVIDSYKQLTDKRQKSKEETYLEKFKEFEEIKAKGLPSDANDIADAYVALISSSRYANEEQKKALLADEFVKEMVDKTISDCIEQEAKGKWAEAYTGYYWLSSLYEDKETYKDKSEELIDKMAIEGSMVDSPCESSEERFEGIDPVMFIRTIKMLDFGYVDLIDYDRVADKAFDRCILLAEVMSFENEDVNVEFDKTQVQSWIAGVRKIRSELNSGPLARLNHKDFLESFLKLLVLNEQTINISNEIIVSHFTEAALSVLDPYTNVVWPFYTKEFEKSITQQFSGIGVEISKSTGDLMVMSLLPGTPAYNSGLDAEDVIEKVDGVPTEDMTINCAVSRITGPDGTDVTLTVRSKDADEARDITIKRAKIVVPTIRGWQRTADAGWEYMIDPESGIGYMLITGFTSTTADYMEKAIKQLEKEGLKGLIIDLRYNSGGLLQTAGEVVDMFVDKGVIVSTKPRWGFGEELKATKKATIPNYPLVLLINGGSASASEIVAGALKDEKYKRATLVGTRTYGKGSVQTITEAPGGGAQLKYTMAFYHLPSGQPVKNRYQLEKEGRDDWGISPDFSVELTPKEAKKYVEVQKDNAVLVKADHDYKENEIARHSAQETVESDPQLATAILVVKAKMIAQNND
ncbi:MAG: S41 family peptidase [Sedimentisphaeraceae bacterium JB056]